MPFRTIISVFLCTAILTSIALAATVTVDQAALKFARSSAALARGDSLIFANHDDVMHNIHIFRDDVDERDLGLQKPGMPLTHKFDKAGRFMVRCNIHPAMKMMVTVN